MQNIFGFIIHPMELGVIWLTVAVGSAGIGIILFTVAVRLVLAPLNIVQLRNAKSMQRLQPMLAELKKKHGKDRQALSQATMELYKEHNVNPAMGCLPTLLQFPVLIGLFYALLHLGSTPGVVAGHANLYTCNNVHVTFSGWLKGCYAIAGQTGSVQTVYNLFHANFLWLDHGLGQHDPLFILPLLAGIAQWVQSRMMLTRSTDPQQQMMNTMMNFMPLMIIFFASRYPSGLSLYWVTSTLIGIAIQYRITGLGLLPSTLAGAGSFLMRSTAPAPASGRPKTPRSTPSNSPRPVRERTAPAEEVNGQNGANGSEASDGSNGAAPVIRPRRQANRARGGRRGGRRG